MKRALAKGYTCKWCKTFHRFSPWAYAHWSGFNHTCECGAITGIEFGEVVFTEPPQSVADKRMAQEVMEL
jgi:hypothetical protein